MKLFACGVVVPGCTAEFQTESEEELMAQIAEHAREAHGMDSIPPEVVEQVKQNIVEA
jgi:predicted small metal-binding protein